MARKHRIWYPGASYHIMCRGNRRHDIFRDDEDREYYLSILLHVQSKFPHLLHSYCLMTNHVHLQIQTKDDSISKIMKRINMLYSIYVNRKYNVVGYLFQGRYRSELIDSDAYQLETSRYIHLNPWLRSIISWVTLLNQELSGIVGMLNLECRGSDP
ncbi:transposase [Ammoniphilus oxalaticus]|uniref:transposase n=1 Tax=Ammoniphilus oxalaticus TaxID=66863 RepID=UPI001FEB994A|nr:transposase [Ammoniphilus oxalaticus]